MGTTLIVLVLIGFIVVGTIAWGAGIYNNLIALSKNVDKAFANIEVILQQRQDELVKLLDTCKGYMQHEQGVLESLTRARTQSMNATDVAAKTTAENAVSSGLRSLFAVAESYPDLKANQNFLDLQDRISTLEETIADRREFFNESVTVYNTRIESFPDLFFAGFLRFRSKPLLEIPKEKTADVKIQFS